MLVSQQRISRVRPPAVAGLFYPKDAEGLRRTLHALLDAPGRAPVVAPAPKALVVPHAGYAYSGSVAAAAYRLLATAAGTIRRVVLLGPSHRVPMRGLAMAASDFFATPCGEIPIDAFDSIGNSGLDSGLLARGAVISFDMTAVGSTIPGKGLKVWLRGSRR